MKRIFMTLVAASAVAVAGAQDIHFADLQIMSKWSNQSLNTEKRGSLHANFRNISYANDMSVRSGGLMLNLPVFRGGDTSNASDKGYFTFTGAAGFDQSNTGYFKSTLAMAGLSYAQPLSANGHYAAIGFQGAFTTNKFGVSGTFPDQLDQYGPISGSSTNDPLRAGNRYSYFSLNAGASVFKSGGDLNWFLGASVRHLNRPNADASKADLFKLSPTVGVQAKVSKRFDQSTITAYSLLNWRAGANETLLGAQYQLTVSGNDTEMENQPDTTNLVKLTIGCGLRLKDALIPNIGIVYNRTTLALHYDMNNSSLKNSGFTRRGFELVLSRRLKN